MFRNIRLLKHFKKKFLLFLFLLIVSFFYLNNRKCELETSLPAAADYYLDLKKVKMGLILNTSACQIPNFNLLDFVVLPHLRQSKQLFHTCDTLKWTEIQGNELILTREFFEKTAASSRSWSCCYKVITRVQQSDDNYDMDADNNILLSTCTPILTERTKMLHKEFIMVECSWNWAWADRLRGFPLMKYFIHGRVSYRRFHAFGFVNKSSRAMEKIQFWKRQRSAKRSARQLDKPPNILIIGLDSTSRLNFRRFMPQTVNLLETMGATEMLGYTKVGENTYPNMCAAIFGYLEEDIKRICHFTKETNLDDCPSIWNRLDAANYLTAHIEDLPEYAIFNFMKAGFVRKPVDFYVRPLFIAAAQAAPYNYSDWNCIGSQTPDEAIISYMDNVIELSTKSEAPIFTFSWSTTYSHNDITGLQWSDQAYAQFILKLKNKGYLDNTVLIMMGDHGYRYGAIRQTYVGYYEDKLPAFWISLPKSIQERFPNWSKALQFNSRRLSSPFTLFWTVNQILDVYTPTPSPSDSKDRDGTIIPRKYQQTFFDIIPESNSCEDLGIQDAYCMCYPTEHVDLEDPLLTESAQLSILTINQDILTPICYQFEFDEIIAGALTRKPLKDGSYVVRYIVTFRTKTPANFLIEGQVNFFTGNKTFSANADVQRMSRIDPSHIRCVSDSRLQLFCLCKYFTFLYASN